MAAQTNINTLRVKTAPGGFYPQAFWWQGRLYRVLELESLRTVGLERRCRVHTAEGPYELAFDVSGKRWWMRRSPGVVERLLARWQNAPRYPLPVWRRRLSRRESAKREPAERGTVQSADGEMRGEWAVERSCA